MAITNKKYLDNSGLIKTLENLNEQFNGIPLKKFLDTKKSTYYLFDSYNGTSVDDLIKYNDTSNVTTMENMFYDCDNLTTIPLLNTSNVTNMRSMFSNCSNLTTIPALNTSNVTNMEEMFWYCQKLTSIPKLDTSNVTNMFRMFYYCLNLTKISMINIGVNLDIHWGSKMEREALLEVLGNLKDLTGQTSKTKLVKH